MKRIAKHYSGIRFTRASVAMGLTALLCMPLQASAEESTSTAPVAQAVQQSRTVKGQVVDEMGEPMIGTLICKREHKCCVLSRIRFSKLITLGNPKQNQSRYCKSQCAGQF